MYLFRTGFSGISKRGNDSNVISAKLPQAVNILKAVDLGVTKSGTEHMGDDVIMQWESKLLQTVRPVFYTSEGNIQSPYELYLYKVKLSIVYKKLSREYEINVFRSVMSKTAANEI